MAKSNSGGGGRGGGGGSGISKEGRGVLSELRAAAAEASAAETRMYRYDGGDSATERSLRRSWRQADERFSDASFRALNFIDTLPEGSTARARFLAEYGKREYTKQVSVF